MFYDMNENTDSPRGHHGPHKHEHHGQGRRGHGPGPWFGHGHGPGRHGLHSGRKLSSSELQLLLVLLLSKQPSHGYELIKSLEERSDGFYVPSPGMIYPALTYLEEIGHASVQAEGAKKRYHLTTEGQEYLQKNQQAAEDTLTELERIGARMANARQAFEEDVDGETYRELGAVRHALRRALRDRLPFTPQEVKRIAAILENAAREIREGD